MAKRKKVEKVSIVVRTFQRNPPKNDYLKFYKIVRYWVKRKYEVSGPELDMLIFLRSEYLFTRTDFNEFHNIFTWNIGRFDKLLREGWIRKYRNAGGGKCAIYDLSSKGKRLVDDVYRKCNGETDFSEVPAKNPVFNRSRMNYMDKVYMPQMKRINVINKDSRQKT